MTNGVIKFVKINMSQFYDMFSLTFLLRSLNVNMQLLQAERSAGAA